MAVNHWETANWLVSQFPAPLKFVNGEWMEYGEGWQVVDNTLVIQRACEIISTELNRVKAQRRAADDEQKGYYTHLIKHYESLLFAPTLKSLVFMLEVQLADNQGWNQEEDYEFPTVADIVDIRSGNRRPASPSDKISLFSTIPYNPEAKAPRWDRFIEEICNGRMDLAAFLQRAVGYSLGGGMVEQGLFILYGPGSNGKNFFLETLLEIFGGLGHQTTFSVLEKAYRSVDAAAGAASPHLAAFEGKRFVMASESHTNTAFNDGLVKSLTGDNYITARQLYKQERVFRNQIKIWLACNNLPQVFDSTPGFWRRLHIIKLDRIFDANDRDLNLRDKLREERSGILNWAIKGAIEWHRLIAEDPAKGGLRPPLCVRQEVQEYRNGTDLVQLFIEENCFKNENVFAIKKDIHRAFCNFCKGDLGVPEWPSKRFFSALTQKGHISGRKHFEGKYPHVVIGICLDKDKAKFPITTEEITDDNPSTGRESGGGELFEAELHGVPAPNRPGDCDPDEVCGVSS